MYIKAMLNKFKSWLYKFMYGRNGYDSLSRALIVPIFVVLIITMFTIGALRIILCVIGWLLIIYLYFRVFSKNIYKRQAENRWFESKVRYFKTRTSQSKQYRFYTCPKCKAHLRVPRGVGKITVTCAKCGYKFDRKA